MTSSHGGTCKAFACSPTQLQAWEGSTEMGGASLLAHNDGLPPGHVQKHTPHVGDVDYGWWSTGVAWWGSVPLVLMTFISKPPKPKSSIKTVYWANTALRQGSSTLLPPDCCPKDPSV